MFHGNPYADLEIHPPHLSTLEIAVVEISCSLRRKPYAKTGTGLK